MERNLLRGMGIDPMIDSERKDIGEKITLIRGFFPTAMPPNEERFDIITALALFEHIPEEDMPAFMAGLQRWLKPGGRIVLTVPSPLVDHILRVLFFLRLVDGMSLEEHHGAGVAGLPALFMKHGFILDRHRYFQLGMNNLFVFRKIAGQ